MGPQAIFKSFGDCAPDGVATLACLGVLIQNLITAFLILSAGTTLIMLILGGIRLSLSGGDPKRVQSARSTITYAIVGIVVVFLSFVILNLLSHISGNPDLLRGPNFPVPSTPPSPT